MEALAAVSLAGNVVQIMQFTGEFIDEIRSIKRTGNPKSLSDFRRLSNSLTTQAGLVRSRLNASNTTLAQEEQVRALIRGLLNTMLIVLVIVPTRYCDRLRGDGKKISGLPR